MKLQDRGWLSWLAWIAALGLVALAVYLSWARGYFSGSPPFSEPDVPTTATLVVLGPPALNSITLPIFAPFEGSGFVQRQADIYTSIPSRPRYDVINYTVGLGDSVFGIAYNFGIEPETLLWSNYDVLKDNPHALTSGMDLKIPPTDGIYYQWQLDDTLESVASQFEVDPSVIIDWSGNRLDLTDPQIEPESWIMIPGGQREFQQWIIPVAARGSAGVSSGVYGAGACPGGYTGLYGSGAFIWPTNNHTLSGNDYWSGHLAIDIGLVTGDPVFAADSGVVMFAGWSTGGYGYVVAIDHGNAYQTLYAHLSSVNVYCGQSVHQGQVIAAGGSTGNSTGPHLHFEIRYQGGFVNPWYVLPAP
ncbi:MAG: LysM peptidoglycan-binding domain-containing M23 family metallopeptidase [Chloroflexi bacterium]|nr:LysM peptidoglycan-binding domain-containing M23 family metallopeptidase [Chloroflexota bacterium]